MTVSGDSHGKGNGIRYVFVVAGFWCVATSHAWKAGTTCRPQIDLDGQQQLQRFGDRWLAPGTIHALESA